MLKTGKCVLAAMLCVALMVGGALAQNDAAQTAKKGKGKGKGKAKAEAREGFVRIFNGKDLEGWDGSPELWSVKDGVIVGRAKLIKQNSFLASKKEYGDFILRFQIKLVDNKGNTGMQFRSVRLPNSPRMAGYQADYADAQKYCGQLYDEAGKRGIMAAPPAETLAKAGNKPGDWNDVEIKAEGDHITISLNGVQTVDYTEKDPKIARTGLLGMQVHQGFDMEVQFRNIRIKELPKK